MIGMITTGMLWFSIVSCALLAGVFFAFSTFIMTALGRVNQAAGISAMNAINESILQSLFMPLFLGSTLSSGALAVLGMLRWDQPGSPAMLAAGLTYVIGMFLFTIVFNVPLNNALAAAGPVDAASTEIWARYLKEWTFWNHMRTAASILAFALFVAALAAR